MFIFFKITASLLSYLASGKICSEGVHKTSEKWFGKQIEVTKKMVMIFCFANIIYSDKSLLLSLRSCNFHSLR